MHVWLKAGTAARVKGPGGVWFLSVARRSESSRRKRRLAEDEDELGRSIA